MKMSEHVCVKTHGCHSVSTLLLDVVLSVRIKEPKNSQGLAAVGLLPYSLYAILSDTVIFVSFEF